jgi:hypothetical protein
LYIVLCISFPHLSLVLCDILRCVYSLACIYLYWCTLAYFPARYLWIIVLFCVTYWVYFPARLTSTYRDWLSISLYKRRDELLAASRASAAVIFSIHVQ